MGELPSWMRKALLATGVMNVLAAGAFLPGSGAVRERLGFPVEGDPFFLLTAGLFVLLFGLGYLWAGLSGRPDRIFIGIAALGKISFFLLVTGFWLAGSAPLRAPVLASADLVFGALFAFWLLGSSESQTGVGSRAAA